MMNMLMMIILMMNMMVTIMMRIIIMKFAQLLVTISNDRVRSSFSLLEGITVLQGITRLSCC